MSNFTLIKQNLTINSNTNELTAKDILAEIEECRAILMSLGYTDVKYNTYHVEFNDRALRTLGRCSYNSYDPSHFTITVNRKFMEVVPSYGFHNMIMHEVIHSVNDCMNHGPMWQAVAECVNKHYQFTPITRTNSYEEYTNEVTAKAINYIIKCKKCGASWKYIRRPKVWDACINGRAKHACGCRDFECVCFKNKK